MQVYERQFLILNRDFEFSFTVNPALGGMF